ncbi:MAG: mannose-1-phosphate guanylyltransferase [Candidatus Dormibacteraceae bacterium]
MVPAGGAGSRLWPRSRRAAPKHTLALSGSGRALVAEAYERMSSIADEVFILTERSQVDLIRGLVPGLGEDRMIVEPSAQGTTNALGLAALVLQQREPDAIMITAAADHVIRGRTAFVRAARAALAVAEDRESLVTIGLRPSRAATGFGYIEAGPRIRIGRHWAHPVRRFVEKPSAVLAQSMVEGGSHFWNLSMFCARLDVFCAELEGHARRHFSGLRRMLAARARGEEEAAAGIYRRLPTTAIDYTIMEQSRRLLMVEAGFEWMDVGSWSDFAGLAKSDRNGNATEGNPLLIDSEGSFVASSGRLIVALGVRDLIVVETDDAILIVPKSRAQEVKRVSELLRARGLIEYL